MEKPIFFTKLSKLDLIISAFYVALGFVSLYFFRNIFSEKSRTENVFLITVQFLFIVQGIRIAKIFVLYTDRIIIRRPLIFFTRIFDVVYKFDEIKDVTFRTVNARGTNDFVIFQTTITTYKSGESYILNDRNQIIQLKTQFENFGIKTFDELK